MSNVIGELFTLTVSISVSTPLISANKEAELNVFVASKV